MTDRFIDLDAHKTTHTHAEPIIDQNVYTHSEDNEDGRKHTDKHIHEDDKSDTDSSGDEQAASLRERANDVCMCTTKFKVYKYISV